MDDEVDYMSDEFLLKCVEASKSSKAPGLTWKHSQKRKIEIDKNNAELQEAQRKKIKLGKELEKTRLKEGLTTSIDSTNKGFALLKKMGYKPGMSLGKQGQGLLEPVPLDVKQDKKGIGWRTLLEQKTKQKEKKMKSLDPSEFRARLISQQQQQNVDKDLWKSKKSCRNLDLQYGVTKPETEWFWPAAPVDEDDLEEEEEEEEIELEPADQLEIITSYLRNTYRYCIWCCIEFNSGEDMQTECPGDTRRDHDD